MSNEINSLKFTVTPGDIENGIQGNAGYCPISLAIERTVGDGCSVQVYMNSISVRDKEGYYAWYGHTEDSYYFMHDFDAGNVDTHIKYDFELYQYDSTKGDK